MFNLLSKLKAKKLNWTDKLNISFDVKSYNPTVSITENFDLSLFSAKNNRRSIGVSNFELLSFLKIPKEDPLYELVFEENKIWQDEHSRRVDKIVKNQNFCTNRVYSKVWDFHYYKNVGINSGPYSHINEYIDVFIDLTSVIKEGRLELMDYRPDKWEEAVYNDLEKLRSRLVEEWKAQAADLSEANFYEKNTKVLEELNAYVNHEVKHNKEKYKP